MKIISWIVGDVENDPRARKVGQWFTKQGHEVIHVQGWYENPEKVVIWPTGEADGCPVYSANKEAASILWEAIGELKPDAVWVHEADAMWPLCARFPLTAVERVRAGWPTYEAGVELVRPPWPIIYDAHEYERGRCLPNTPEVEKLERTWREAVTVRYADAMVAASPAVAAQMSTDYGRSVGVVPAAPWKLDRELDRGLLFRELDLDPDDDFVVAYAGILSRSRRLDLVASAVEDMPSTTLVLMGPDRMDDALRKQMKRIRARILESKPYPHPNTEGPTMLDWLAGADWAINLTESKWPSYRLAMPNKLFEYAWADVWAVHGDQIDSAWACEKYGLGASWADGSPEQLAHFIETFTHSISDFDGISRFQDEWCLEVKAGPAMSAALEEAAGGA